MFKQLFAGLCCLGFIACLGNRPAHEASSLEAVNAVVGRYVESINAADTGLARQVWAEDADISFIHPMGHERGWAEIKANLYEKIMRDLLSKRSLKPRDVSVKLYGDFAVVEFYWTFDATWRKDGSPLQTKGRETQVLWRAAGGEWRIVHVHYSGMPAATPSQGL